jgi:hypothetical protein
VALVQVQVEQSQRGDFDELVEVSRDRRQQRRQVGADVVHRKRDLDLGALEDIDGGLPPDLRAGQGGLRHAGERRDPRDPRTVPALEFSRSQPGSARKVPGGCSPAMTSATFSTGSALSTR